MIAGRSDAILPALAFIPDDLGVRDALAELRVGRTTLVVAHRLSTIRAADRIIVLNHGRITEAGSHEELMRIEGGLYQRLYLLQQIAV